MSWRRQISMPALDFEIILANFPFIASILLFSMGCLIILTQQNLIKKVIGINVMETSIFLFFLSLGNIIPGGPPIVRPGMEEVIYVNPLPQALILTGIVVSFSVTAFALAIIVSLYRFYGTVYVDELMKMR